MGDISLESVGGLAFDWNEPEGRPSTSLVFHPSAVTFLYRAKSRVAGISEEVLCTVAESLSAKRSAARGVRKQIERPVRVRVARAHEECAVLGEHVSHRGRAPLAGRTAERLDLNEASRL